VLRYFRRYIVALATRQVRASRISDEIMTTDLSKARQRCNNFPHGRRQATSRFRATGHLVNLDNQYSNSVASI